jgi:hypothetical protein
LKAGLSFNICQKFAEGCVRITSCQREWRQVACFNGATCQWLENSLLGRWFELEELSVAFNLVDGLRIYIKSMLVLRSVEMLVAGIDRFSAMPCFHNSFRQFCRSQNSDEFRDSHPDALLLTGATEGRRQLVDGRSGIPDDFKIVIGEKRSNFANPIPQLANGLTFAGQHSNTVVGTAREHGIQLIRPLPQRFGGRKALG